MGAFPCTHEATCNFTSPFNAPFHQQIFRDIRPWISTCNPYDTVDIITTLAFQNVCAAETALPSETFSALLALCAWNSPSPVNSPHKGQLRGALMFSLICAWTNGWVNTPDAGNFRLHRAHYDLTVMDLGPVLLQRTNAVARRLTNGSTAFIETCAAIGRKNCESVRSL